ncbi:MAG: hypothetical protein ACREMV_11800 [Gemmatimonadales bacterium]
MSATQREDELEDGRLRDLAARLGAAADRLDVERTARAVVERLRVEPETQRSRWMQPAWLRIAAALVLLVGAGAVGREVLRSRATVDHYVVEELTDLSADELGQLLASLDRTLDLTAPTTGEDLDGLDQDQLGDVLENLDG